MIVWSPIGKIITADSQRWWLDSFTGASFASPVKNGASNGLYKIYFTGRDSCNKSHIGFLTLDLTYPLEPIFISENPIIELGSKSAFNSDGNSYPWIVEGETEDLLFFVGWSQDKNFPFKNQIGLSPLAKDHTKIQDNPGRAKNLFPKNSYGTGSCCVIRDGEKYTMWFTSFTGWHKDKANKIQPNYNIRTAVSTDCINWDVIDRISIDYSSPEEHAICRPTVIKLDKYYHMWFCSRGEKYHIYHAHSIDGIEWIRDSNPILSLGNRQSWADQEQCYPFVFKHEEALYMLYCGNNYGKDGLGLARGEIIL